MAEEDQPKYTLTLPDGQKVHRSRDFSGRASASYENGESYSGDFVDGVRIGSGKYIYVNGDEYVGGFDENKKHGMGRFRYSGKPLASEEEADVVQASGLYQGEFFDGLKQGQGSFRYQNGDVYSGSWLKGKKHGGGTYVFADGSKLSGIWSEGYLSKGEWQLIGGLVWQGEFVWNYPKGSGEWLIPSGRRLFGEFIQRIEEDTSETEQKKEPSNISLLWIPYPGPLVDCN